MSIVDTCGDCGRIHMHGTPHDCPSTIRMEADPFVDLERIEAYCTEATPDPFAVTDERGIDYGHPSEHFAKTVAIIGIVFGERRFCDMEPCDWPVVMICDKLARFSHTLDHADSMLDIGGYAKTWPMAQEPVRAKR